MEWKQRYSQYGLLGLVLGLGIILGISFARTHYIAAQANIIRDIQSLRQEDDSYKFINPLLLYKLPSSAVLPEYNPFTVSVQKVISQKKSSHIVQDVSVYFRDLNGDRWIGVDQSAQYTPGSLLKVGIMTTYLKQAETDPRILNTYITYTNAVASMLDDLPYDQGTHLIIGKRYLVSDLINRMIIESDNGATYALLSKVDLDILHRLFTDLDLSDPSVQGRDFSISAQQYSRFFRILYNGTYLSKEMSEKALFILSQTDFKEGLVAGVPAASVVISHKYGESVSTDENNNVRSIELHDCGIIYHAVNPYFLCVMTRGDKVENLKKVIEDISRVVYQEVSKDKN